MVDGKRTGVSEGEGVKKVWIMFAVMLVVLGLSIWATWVWFGWKMVVIVVGFLFANNIDRECSAEIKNLRRGKSGE